MFDQQHLEATSSYTVLAKTIAQSSQDIFLEGLIPLVIATNKRLKYEWDKQAIIEVGEEHYAMSLDENGAWKWHKIDPLSKEIISEWTGDEEIKDLWQDLLAKYTVVPPQEITPEALIPLIENINEKLRDEWDGKTETQYEIFVDESGVNIVPITPPNDLVVSEGVKPPGESVQPEIITPPEESVIPEVIIPEGESVQLEIITPPEESVIPEVIIPEGESVQLEIITPPEESVIPEGITSSEGSELDPQHWEEITIGSAIDPEIAALNFKSLHLEPVEQEHEAWTYLMYSNNLERNNSGRLPAQTLKRYSHLDKGGWWCESGVDPRGFSTLAPGEKPELKIWGCFKPNEPRQSLDNPDKKIKYEHPPKEDLSIFLLKVPDRIADQIYAKAGVTPTESDRASGFWYCAWKHNIPMTITEGAKKAASILSQGEAAVGLPGIYAGYRSQDDLGNSVPPVLQDELAVFATKDRDIRICFDHETRTKTKRNIEIATYRTGQLLESAGAKVSVINLPGPEKGIDDLIVARGPESFTQVTREAASLEDWWRDNQPPDLRLTVFLKNGQQIKLYEQKSDGEVTVEPVQDRHQNQIPDPWETETANISWEPFLQDPWDNHLGDPWQEEMLEEVEILNHPPGATPEIASVNPSPVALQNQQPNSPPVQRPVPEFFAVHPPPLVSQIRTAPKEVSVYKNTFQRRFLISRQNNQIASAAESLLKKYGLEQEDGSQIYRADAFTIKKQGKIYTVHHRDDEESSLMQFQVNRRGDVKILQPPEKMLPVERQEFLLVADYLKFDQQQKPSPKLPSVDEDTRKLATTLGSLSPAGTHRILESFRHQEVLKILTHTLDKAKTSQLEVGNFTIKVTADEQNGKSVLSLFKQEYGGPNREAVRFELLTRSPDSFTNNVAIMAISDLDLQKLKLLAQKLEIPEITPNFNSAPPDLLLPLHPALKKAWNHLEDSQGWSADADQGIREQIQHEGKFTVPEQRELYFKILLQSKSDIQNPNNATQLPPLENVIQDLKTIEQEAIASTYTPQTKKSLPILSKSTTELEV